MNTCDICGGTFSLGARILWRLKSGEAAEQVGFSATHIVCPRTLRNLAAVVVLVVVLAALLLVLG